MAEENKAEAAPMEPAEAMEIAPGLGIVSRVGWEKDEDGREVFRAIIWFPNGPPDLPFNTVWDQRPVIVALADASAGSGGETNS